MPQHWVLMCGLNVQQLRIVDRMGDAKWFAIDSQASDTYNSIRK
jgi:hypothetical protein